MLTATQVAAIILLLQAFGVSPSVISVVRADITPTAYIAPTQPYIPPVVQSPVQTPTTPVAPVLGAVTQPTPACDDTPQFNIVAFTDNLSNQGTILSQPISITASSTTYPYVLFANSVTSDCGSKWTISEWVPTPRYGQQEIEKNAPSVSYDGGDTFNGELVPQNAPGTYVVTFVATDGNTTGTTTVPIIAD